MSSKSGHLDIRSRQKLGQIWFTLLTLGYILRLVPNSVMQQISPRWGVIIRGYWTKKPQVKGRILYNILEVLQIY